MKYIDKFLNGITMYKLVLYGLQILAGISIIFGFLGFLPYSGFSLLLSCLLLTLSCYISNYLLAKFFKVQTNVESSSITAFILFLVLFPVVSRGDVWITLLVGVIAMASKYILAINKKHIFNPTAISIVIVGAFGSGVASWWIGNSVMLILVSILGFLVLRKTKRFELFFSFIIFAVVSMFVFGLGQSASFTETLMGAFVSGPIIFLGTIMLTEPMTTPPTRKLQLIYGMIVGVMFGLQFHIGPIYSTPALALIVGNVFSYFVSPRIRLVLTLIQKNKLSADVWDFVWQLDRKISFKAGQYLEWTLGHDNPDSRGNRRFFTIASSPTEDTLRLGVKFYENSSTFKKKLSSLNIGDEIIASQLSGEFVLPEDPKEKLAFIAGGIGVTPFRSIIKNLLDAEDKREVTLFYSNRTSSDIVYKEIFAEAESKIGLKTIYAVNDLAGAVQTSNTRVGFVTAEMIMAEVPDYRDRTFYISGPPGMVSAFEDTLAKIGVKKSRIKTDFFPGYV